jgi:hypothetical protein
MSNIVTKVVNSENPIEHWNDIQSVEDKVVMDFGCGWLFQQHESTPEYFINRGAKHLIGIEAACGEVEKLKELYPTHTFICKTIVSKDDIVELLKEYKPDTIKMDIEGYESVIEHITTEEFDCVKEIGVEYHNPECKHILETKLNEFGFEIFAINQFGWFCTDINIMGILHAKRK